MSVEEVVAERYARATGMDVEEAKRVLSLLREKHPDRYDRIASVLSVMAEYGDKIKDPALLAILRPLIAEEAVRATAGPQQDAVERFRNLAAEVQASVAALKMLDAVLPRGENELAAKVEEALRKMEELHATTLQVLQRLAEQREERQGGGEEREELARLAESLASLSEALRELKEKVESRASAPRAEELTPEKVVELIREREEQARRFLENLGYRVSKGPTREEIVEAARRLGLRVEEDKVSVKELEKLREEYDRRLSEMAKEAYEKGKEDARKELDEKTFERQLQVVENIVSKAIDRLIGEVFAPIVRAWAGSGVGEGGGEAEQGEPEGDRSGG